MSRKLEYGAREYNDMEREAERIHWNDDKLSSSDLEKKTNTFVANLHESFGYDDENANRLIRRATHQ